jgi:hypothetical protein
LGVGGWRRQQAEQQRQNEGRNGSTVPKTHARTFSLVQLQTADCGSLSWRTADAWLFMASQWGIGHTTDYNAE